MSNKCNSPATSVPSRDSFPVPHHTLPKANNTTTFINTNSNNNNNTTNSSKNPASLLQMEYDDFSTESESDIILSRQMQTNPMFSPRYASPPAGSGGKYMVKSKRTSWIVDVAETSTPSTPISLPENTQLPRSRKNSVDCHRRLLSLDQDAHERSSSFTKLREKRLSQSPIDHERASSVSSVLTDLSLSTSSSSEFPNLCSSSKREHFYLLQRMPKIRLIAFYFSIFFFFFLIAFFFIKKKNTYIITTFYFLFLKKSSHR
jgi:hypothetical protein